MQCNVPPTIVRLWTHSKSYKYAHCLGIEVLPTGSVQPEVERTHTKAKPPKGKEEGRLSKERKKEKKLKKDKKAKRSKR